MSEKIYLLLLRLYPARFRKLYGEEALQLLRDRLRDEVGLAAKLRLWHDLVADLAISVPGEYRRPAVAIRAQVAQANGMPSFSVLDEQPPRPGTLMVAGLLSAAGLVAFFVLISMAGARYPLRRMQSQASPPAAVSTAPTPPPTGTALGGRASAPANTLAQDRPVSFAAGAAESAPVVSLDPAERHRIASAVASDLETYYFDRSLGRDAAQTILNQEKQGADNAVRTGADLALLLTRQIRGVTADPHLSVVYSLQPLPPQPAAALSPQALAAYRTTLLQDHCAIDRDAVLPGNIGYLKLNAFPMPSVCGSQMRAALASIDNTNAAIFDLRDNRGGDPAMVALVASYLFAHAQPWYDPKQPGQSVLPVTASHLADKPVYILTTVLTLSAAEQFSYNLQMLHRATLVGEITGGSAHVGVFHRIDDHFGIGIPEFPIVNPYSSRDWEGVGITPDVRASPADALAIAEQLARRNQTANAR